MPRAREFQELIYEVLPDMGPADFTSLYEEKPNSRKWNRHLTTQVDADMFVAAQELASHKDLPFQGNMSALGRHVWAAGIESLRLFLDKDTRALWSALQATQRRLTAERYVATAEEQVKEAAELLSGWTGAHEWDAVYNDMAYALQAIEDLPTQAWRRRVAKMWLISPEVRKLLAGWEQVMNEEAPNIWRRIAGILERMRVIVDDE